MSASYHDLAFPGMLHGVTVRSPAARGVIRNVDFLPGVPWEEFTIVTAADVPGVNRVRLIVDDQPYLADGRVNHPEEPVLLLAHPDRQIAEEGRRRVRLDIDPLPPVFSIAESLCKEEIVWGPDNVFKAYIASSGRKIPGSRSCQVPARTLS